MMARLAAFLDDETAASAAEYAMLLAIVGGALAAAAIFLGGAISTAMNDAGACIASPGSATCA